MVAHNATRRRSKRLASSRFPLQQGHLDVAIVRGRPRSASDACGADACGGGLQLVPINRSTSPSKSQISSSHEIVLRDNTTRNMVLHNRTTRQLSVYRAPSPTDSDRNSRDVCPFCLRPLYDYNSPSSATDTHQFKSNLFHAHDYFSRLGQMHLLEREDIDCQDQDRSDHLSENSFNSGYYKRFFTETKKLGSGGYGSVYLCSHSLDGVLLGTYACKKIPVGDNRPWLNRVLSEVRAVESLRHPNIVAYKHSWLEITQTADFGPKVPVMFMLMEYANMGNLSSYVTNLQEKKQMLSEAEIWSLFRGTSQGLRHLHHSGIIHRDIKPENLLLTADFDVVSQSSSLRILISDFGESETLKAATRRPRTGNTGTLFFCAPELLLENSDYDDKADIYSLGVVLYFLAYGQGPFDSFAATIQSPEHLYDLLQTRSLKISFPSNIPRGPELKELIKTLTAFDSKDRFTIDQVLNYPILNNTSAISPPIFKTSSNITTVLKTSTLLIANSQEKEFREMFMTLFAPILHAAALILHQIIIQLQPMSPFRVLIITLLGCTIMLLSQSKKTTTTKNMVQSLFVLMESLVSGYPGQSTWAVTASVGLFTLQILSIFWRNKYRR